MSRVRPFATLVAFFTLSFQSTILVNAQRSALDTFAITNAKIVTVSGSVIERGTVVIRDGLIAAVGEKVTAPADAKVIDGTGLTVYPGLFDSNTSLGTAAPTPAPAGGPGGFLQAQLRPATTPAPSGPNSTQQPGLQPELMAEDSIKPGGTEIEAARNVGITTALTAPRTGIWIGQSALINLAGDTPQQMIVKSPVAMHVGFQRTGGAGGYPGSLMGVFASLRQMLLDAQRYKTALEIYERAPRGTRRPDLDRSLAALIPVLDGKMPVVMTANSQREIERALDLAQEFKLHAMIAGGAEAATVADRLRELDVPVLLSLNFPRRTTTAAPEAEPDSLRTLRARVEAQKAPGKLAAARVRFAFQSGSLASMSDYLANAVKAIENGLSREEALRALTIRAAEIFGVADRLGSIETGKIANLTITRGDIFDRNTRVTNLFIDGRSVDLRPAPAAPAAGSGAGPRTAGAPAEEARVNFAGTWNISISVSGQALPATLVFREEGGALSGSLQTQIATADFTGGTMVGSAFHMVVSAIIQGQPVELTIDGTVQGDQINGTVQSAFGPATFTGSRQP